MYAIFENGVRITEYIYPTIVACNEAIVNPLIQYCLPQ